jgi:hypothetical protein
VFAVPVYGRRVTQLRPSVTQRVLTAAAGIVLVAVLVVGGFDEGGWVLGVALLGAALGTAVFWRADRLRVDLGADVVVVVNFWHTVALPWGEVERFGYDSGAWVRTRAGRDHPITAFSPPPGALASVERRNRAAVRTMERLRKRRRGNG